MEQPNYSAPLFSQSAFKSVPWVFVNKIVNTLVHILLSLLIVRGLGPLKFGQYTILHHTASYILIFASLGLNSALLRYVSAWRGKKEVSSSGILLKLLTVQLLVCIVFGVAFFYLGSHFQSLFSLPVNGYWLPLLLLLIAYVVKEWTHNLLTAFYVVHWVALSNAIYGILVSLALIALMANQLLTVKAVLICISIGLLIALAIAVFQVLGKEDDFSLKSFVNASPEYSSLLKLSLPLMGNGAMTKILQQYSEVFFLGALITPAAAGYYALAYETTFMMIGTIPLSMHTLMMSAVSESYSKDPSCLPHTICAVFRFLILICLPLTTTTFFFFPEIVYLVYGSSMEPTAAIGPWIALMHLFGLFSIPLSLGIFAKQDVHRTVFFQLCLVVLNIVLDVLLIAHWDLIGACLAFVLTFILTLPWRIQIIKRSIGGTYFPIYFFIKVSLICFLSAASASFTTSILSFYWVPLKVIVSGVLTVMLLRLSRVITIQDLEFFSSFSKPIYGLLKKVLIGERGG